jgi:murein DD-endopeptidase MepM/ murein hydrolase activator NlpD
MKRKRHIRVLTGASLSALAALAVALPGVAGAQQASSGATEAPPNGAAAGARTDETGTTSTEPGPATAGSGGQRDSVRSASRSSSAAANRRKKRRFGDRTLRYGDKGRDVRRLQKILRRLNMKVRVTRRFNKDTRAQVRRFDIWKEKRVNGMVHPKQARRMKKMDRRDVQYRKHMFPVRGPHSYGSSGSRFGAPRSGHTHQGQDMAAASGTKLVSVHEGRVAYKQYQAGGAGHYVVIHGKDGSDSVYMHMVKPASVEPGQRVLAGTKIGRVGSTGSSTGPHLHFELWTRHWFAGGSPYDPLPKLQKWDRRT